MGIVWISASDEICKKHLTFFLSVFSYFSHTIGSYFSHDLGIYFFINYVLGQYYCVKTDIPLNMIIGIGLKIDPGWLQQKCISGYFSQIGDINNTHRWLLLKCLWKQMSWSPFKVKQCKNSKIVIFSSTLFVCLSFLWSKG